MVNLTRSKMRRRGMTLMELMVSVAILSIMILGFSNVLSQTQRVVNDSQRLMRANASIASISQLMRTDFRNVSKIGFMKIKGDFIAFSTAGPAYSLTSNQRGLGKFIAYRVADDLGNTATDKEVLCRQAFVLSEAGIAPDVTPLDVWGLDLAGLQIQNPTALSTLADSIDTNASYQPLVAVPPISPTNFKNSWQVLVGGVQSNFSIRYGQVAVEYDSANPGQLKRKILSWTTTANKVWHRFDQNGWPDFVSIQFGVKDRSAQYDALRAAGGSTGTARVYEIVCGINR